jgi:hypothetical protein
MQIGAMIEIGVGPGIRAARDRLVTKAAMDELVIRAATYELATRAAMYELATKAAMYELATRADKVSRHHVQQESIASLTPILER